MLSDSWSGPYGCKICTFPSPAMINESRWFCHKIICHKSTPGNRNSFESNAFEEAIHHYNESTIIRENNTKVQVHPQQDGYSAEMEALHERTT